MALLKRCIFKDLFHISKHKFNQITKLYLLIYRSQPWVAGQRAGKFCGKSFQIRANVVPVRRKWQLLRSAPCALCWHAGRPFVTLLFIVVLLSVSVRWCVSTGKFYLYQDCHEVSLTLVCRMHLQLTAASISISIQKLTSVKVATTRLCSG